jgi:hypothetical protein
MPNSGRALPTDRVIAGVVSTTRALFLDLTERRCSLGRRRVSSPYGALLRRSCASLVVSRPFKDDVGLVADGAPDADGADVRTGFGAKEMVSPPFEHRLAAARPTKQEDTLLARNVDHHFVHREQIRRRRGRSPDNSGEKIDSSTAQRCASGFARYRLVGTRSETPIGL